MYLVTKENIDLNKNLYNFEKLDKNCQFNNNKPPKLSMQEKNFLSHLLSSSYHLYKLMNDDVSLKAHLLNRLSIYWQNGDITTTTYINLTESLLLQQFVYKYYHETYLVNFSIDI